jgi:cytochrome c oxidase subunit 4
MSAHVSPVSRYITIFGALMVGTALTVGAAFVDLPFSLNFPVALAIAVIKASLVIAFFMHVKYSSRYVKLIVGVALFFFGIMFTLTFTDYFSREWFTAPGGSTSPASILTLTGGRPAAR